MYPWLKIPLFRAFIPFLTGILIYKYFSGISQAVLFVLIIIPLCYILLSKFYFSKKHQYFKFRWIDGLCLTLIFLIGGYLITYSNNQLISKKHFSHFLIPGSTIVIKITQPPEEKTKTLKIQADVIAVINSNSNIQATGKILTYIGKDSLAKSLVYGDIIAVKNNFTDIPAPMNPGQFDYKSNLANKSIHQQSYLKSDQWKFICHGKQHAFMRAMFRIRNVFHESIRANFKDESQQAILLALLIGYTSEITDEIRQSFTDTGIMHLLAVSGMHVGLIFMVLNLIFKSLLKLRYGNIFFIIAITIILWIYAGITGFSPSVLRATIMFNFLLIGKNIRKVNFIYNSILVSIFFLLLYDPLLIYNVGFQLSYAAVIGIVFVQPYLNSLLTSKSWIIQKLWPLISVTLSAQFFTLPLILYYFSQFPVYFFISNLLIIPISTLVIYLGFVVVFFNVLGVSSFTFIFAFITKYTMELMTRIIFYIRQLPFGLIDNIYLNSFMALILFIAILYMCFWIFYKNRRYLILCLVSLIVFVFSISIWNFKNLKREQLVIYGIPGQTLIAIQEHKKGYYIGDSSIIYNSKQLRINSFRNMIESGISFRNTPRYIIDHKIENNNLIVNNRLICANSIRILCLDHAYHPCFSTERIKVDFLLLAHNPIVKIEDLKKDYEFMQIVFDCSDTPWKIKQWKSDCEKQQIKYYDINSSGAMIIDI
jgi:competence protein ComEC